MSSSSQSFFAYVNPSSSPQGYLNSVFFLNFTPFFCRPLLIAARGGPLLPPSLATLPATRQLGETEPGLVALYDIRPGNGAGLFLQPPGARMCGAFLVSHPRMVVGILEPKTRICNADPYPLE